jgi:hypothetical protein
METKRRFVLFPIQYPEVSIRVLMVCDASDASIDLANVQEGRGFVLDC